MEEELNEHDLEEKLYAMLHHVDETKSDVKENSENDDQTAENTPRSTLRRYWRTSGDNTKATAPKDAQSAIKSAPRIPPSVKPVINTTVAKDERRKQTANPPSINQPVIQLPPQNVKSTIEILDTELDKPVILESSDEDEVVEVALPPKPTITIESSDEDELQIIKPNSPTKLHNKLPERSVSASPVPSVVSSVSDEFIRGDCIALNISSRRTDNPSFDFSLHGSDLLDQSTPSKKKKKKKSKEALTSTPIVTQKSAADECFATPKSKAKNKKRKSYTISEKSVPNPDVYDSDSNQSIIETNKNGSYIVSEKSLPSADVYESDSSYSEVVKEKNIPQTSDTVSSDSNISLEKTIEETPKIPGKNKHSQNESAVPIVDLTLNDTYISLDTSDICESIVMGNVSGFPESENYGDENVPQNDISKFVSTKIPPILNEDLDFDNLKGKNKVCKRRRYSLTTLRADMEKFYNESWGGENFNHREIQKNMSRDKSLWAIDPKDRVPTSAKRRVICGYCNRTGHRDESCRMKPPVCYMCGHTGHFEPRCPRKICVNCGSPNHMYSTMCRNCCSWGTIRCNECGQNGHPASHCPDIWRRYHNTIDLNVPLEKCAQTRKHFQLYCSGCSRRGHLIHTCRSTVPFSGLPINSPYVYLYRPVYSSSTQDIQNSSESNNSKNPKAFNNSNSQESAMSPAMNPRSERNKRQSKSPTVHETHVNKKRNLSVTDEVDLKRSTKSPVNNNSQRKTSLSIDDNNKSKKDKTPNVDSTKTQSNGQKALDFIAVGSTNFDKRGHIIQDNEVSDTSDVVTSARIYVTNEIINNLKSKAGEEWLTNTMKQHNVVVECVEMNSFLSIRGKVGDQEAFQTALREWSNIQNEETTVNDSNVSNDSKNDQCDLSLIPKNRNNLLRQLSKALNSLKEDIGDPKDLYKELTYFQNRHQQLLKQKTISPKQVTNNRCNINLMLKKLNMVLLGQAGLADGSQHLSELYLFHEQLLNSTQKFIPPELRKEIGHHYYNIFAAIPRDDYVELLKKFYQTSTTFKKKKKERSVNFNPKINRFNKSINSIPQQMRANVDKPTKFNDNVSSNNMRQKLVFYHQRLLKTRPNGAVLKKTRVDLVRKLHSFIASMFKNEKVSSKTMKKMRKAQEQAQTFLANV